MMKQKNRFYSDFLDFFSVEKRLQMDKEVDQITEIIEQKTKLLDESKLYDEKEISLIKDATSY